MRQVLILAMSAATASGAGGCYGRPFCKNANAPAILNSREFGYVPKKVAIH